MGFYGNRLKELRISKDLKQKDIANILHVKENTYSKWEKESNDISLSMINSLANYYDVNLDYLLGLTNEIKPSVHKTIDYNKLTDRLKALRKEHHLNQVELSDKTGFAQTTYSSFETGFRVPTTFKLFHIAKFYHISFDYLVGRSDEKSYVYEKS